MATKLKFYYDLMSQPCRAIYMFLKINNIEYDAMEVALRKGEHMTPEFSKINPFQRVPVIDDGGFLLTESIAILKYLCDKNRNSGVAEHWYPTDLQQRARVDEYMSWQHLNTRIHAAMVFRVQVLPFDNLSDSPFSCLLLIWSVAILVYLSRKYNVPNHWYPSDIYQQARIDEYTAWQHTNTRMHAAEIFQLQVIEPRMWNIPIDHEKLRHYKSQLATTVEQIETVFLADRHFLCGDNISIADLLGVCELMQPLATGHNPCEGHEKLTAWMERVKQRLEPHFDEAHKIVFRVRERFLEGKL